MNYRLAQAVILVVMAFLASSCTDRESMEIVNLTQCVKSFDGPPRRPEQRGFFADAERGCWGQRWSIPQAYLPTTTRESNNEFLKLMIMLPDLVPGGMMEKSSVSWVNEIKLRPITHAGFEIHRQHIREAAETTFGAPKSGRKLFGMDVYESKQPRPDYRSTYLFSEEQKDVYAICLVAPNLKIDDKPPYGTCEVRTNLDQQVDITYNLRFSDMPHMFSVNEQLLKLVRTFVRQ